MENSIHQQNKAIVREAFETAFQASRLPGGRTGSLTGSLRGLMPDSFRLATIRDLGVLNSVSAAASACHQHTSYVLLSMHSVIEKLSGAS
jgi:hypothetical protein